MIDAVAHSEMSQAPRRELPGTGWQIWRWAALRSAGFPAALVRSLAAPALAAAARALLAAEANLEEIRQSTLKDLHAEHARTQRPQLRKAIGRLRGSKPVLELADHDAAALALIVPFNSAYDDVMLAQAAIVSSAAADQLATSATLRAIAARPDFQEAVIWQNSQAYTLGIDWILRHPERHDSSAARVKERLIAIYAQRYCVKNDMIGFFGPLAWATFGPDGPPVDFQPGPTLLRSRTVYFENWGIAALARQLGQRPELKPWLRPHRLPLAYLRDTTLHFPYMAALVRSGKLPAAFITTAIELSPAQLQVLACCTGRDTAQAIARTLIADPASALNADDQVYAVLQQLCAIGAIDWTLHAPPALHPEQSLRAALEGIEHADLRQQAVAPIQRLEQARAAVAAAAGSPQRLLHALTELDTMFQEMTGQSHVQSAGQAYAARTLVYEDCQRDCTLTLGPDLLDRLAAPLELVLTSARWFTHTIAESYRAAFKDVHARLAATAEGGAVDMLTFAGEILPLLQHTASPTIVAATQRYQQLWNAVLAPSTEVSRCDYRSADIGAQIHELFAAPHAGWPMARYCAPDVLIAASSPAAIGAGDYQLVLGELHLFNALSTSCLIADSPADVRATLAQHLPTACIRPATAQAQTIQRTAAVPAFDRDLCLEYTAAPAAPEYRSVIAIAELVVVDQDGGLLVRSRAGSLCLDVVEFFDFWISNQCLALPSIHSAGHSPRLTIDGVVVGRETWRLSAEACPFVSERAADRLFVAARRWANRHSLPRFLFARVPTEQKPIYVDLDSPIYLALLAKAIRKTKELHGPEAVIILSEMLPDLDQAWVTDAAGQHYTSELRMVSVDPRPWRAPDETLYSTLRRFPHD
jgi:hypothetical protein